MLVLFFSTFFLFMLGAAVGSFLNVLISRSLTGEQWQVGRSHCDYCQQQLAWFDLIPIISYLGLKGRTRCCGKSLSVAHPVVELLTGSLFVWWYWIGMLIYFQLTGGLFAIVQPLFWLVVGILLLVIVVIDFQYLVIPDLATLLLTILVLCYRVLLVTSGVMQSRDLLLSLLAAIAISGFYYALWWLTRGRGLGFGDVKLALPLAILAGWPRSLVALAMSFLVGGLVASCLLVFGRRGRKDKISFGPFMVAGLLISLVWGDLLLGWYLSLL